MPTAPKRYITPEEYLEIERKAEFKSEYYAGEMFAMAGGSKVHALIASNLIGELRNQLKGHPCAVYTSDVRVYIEASGLYAYPDVTVVCGEGEVADRSDIITNPSVIIEVLSESTKDYDRGMKFELYRKAASLQEYVLVAQDKPHVEHYVRQDGTKWLLTETEDLQQSILLTSIGCQLPLREIYDRVRFSSGGPAAP